jgi:hypothetical protein
MSDPMLKLPSGINTYLARLLGVGSWSSIGLIAVGTAMETLHLRALIDGASVVSAGIVLLLALPPLGVLSVAIGFMLSRDRSFALIAWVVLAITVASIAFGVRVT